MGLLLKLKVLIEGNYKFFIGKLGQIFTTITNNFRIVFYKTRQSPPFFLKPKFLVNPYTVFFKKMGEKNVFFRFLNAGYVSPLRHYNYSLLNSILLLFFDIKRFLTDLFSFFLKLKYYAFGFGVNYICVFFVVLFVDACLTDDEPLWEPIEWSLVQTWILIIFLFGWVAENLIVSRYGSYTGRDKRVWLGWFKTFWLIEIYYILNFGVAACFVIVPFYHEINYALPLVASWWNWFNRVFFFKFIGFLTLVLLLSSLIQSTTRWLNFKKSLSLIILINLFLGYLLYTHFIMSFFGYLTNPIWYQKVRPVDYIQLSHEPSKWGWGVAKRDHFTYHPIRTIFWFKSDNKFAESLLLFHLFIFLSLFFINIYWLALLRRVWSTKEVPFTYLTYCVSSIRQFFFIFLFLFIFILLSYVTQYWRLPIEFHWVLNNSSWLHNFYLIFCDYPLFFYLTFFS